MAGSMILVIGFVAAAVIAIVFISRFMNKKDVQELAQSQQEQEPELTDRFFMGRYLRGLPGFQDASPIVFCGVTQDSFVFRKETQGAVIGRIPRLRVDSVQAAQQDAKNAVVRITWQDTEGAMHNAQFQFTDKASAAQADTAAAMLRKWVAPATEHAEPHGAACTCS